MRRGPASPRRARGFTLVELMVGLVLGLIVTAAALAMFLSNRQVYATTENLGRVQETVRTAYELMVRDLREAAGNPCETGLPIVNVLNNPGASWWTNFDGAVRGYGAVTAFPGEAFGTAFGTRIANTDAIELKSAVNDGVTIVSHNPASAQFKVNTNDHGFDTGDIVMVCDFDHAAILQVSNAQPGINDTIVHNTGTGTPGNCSKGLGFSAPPNCTVLGSPYTYGPNSTIARLRLQRWYIGNGRRGPALFQAVVVNNGGALQIARQEIADGVRDMRLQYLLVGANDYVVAGSIPVADWNTARVLAVRIVLMLESANADNGAAPVQRTLEHTVTLRNRVP